jgi:hypothetical protein
VTTRPRRRSARSTALSTESQIYDGAKLLGTVTGRVGAFKAATAAGRKLGMFRTPQEAMLAVVTASREAGGGP